MLSAWQGHYCALDHLFGMEQSVELLAGQAAKAQACLAERQVLPVGELRAIVESSANLEVSAMEKGLSTLATCSGMAPMIGFLGTVVGMVQAFYDMAQAGTNINITLLSRGIYTAMITTVAGLIVGIMAYFAYNALTARIDKVVNKMEETSADFMETMYEVKNKK